MNYDIAAAIAAEVTPTLLVDPPNPNIPNTMVVRKAPGGMPFSITLVSANPADFQEIPAQPAVEAIPAVPATEDHPGHPAIPAKPAVAARTITGQVAEAEAASLLHALKEAMRVLPEPPAPPEK